MLRNIAILATSVNGIRTSLDGGNVFSPFCDEILSASRTAENEDELKKALIAIGGSMFRADLKSFKEIQPLEGSVVGSRGGISGRAAQYGLDYCGLDNDDRAELSAIFQRALVAPNQIEG